MLCTTAINTSNTISTQTGAAERLFSSLYTNSCYYVITIAFNRPQERHVQVLGI